MKDKETKQPGEPAPTLADLSEGTAKAYQYVAQSTALAIQDAVDRLRNINTISTTAIGVAMAQALENPSNAQEFQTVIEMAQEMARAASDNFLNVSNNAAAILNNFPKGD